MANRYCPHYFLKDCNLFDYEMDENILLDVLGKVHYFLKLEHLTTWFENEYIPMAQSTLSRRKHMIRSGLPVHREAIVKHWSQQDRSKWYNFFNRGISTNSMQFDDVDMLLMATDLLRLAWNVSLNESITFSNPEILNVLFTFAFSMKEHNVYHLFKRDIFTKISYPPLSHCTFEWLSLKSKWLLKLVFRSNSIDYFLRVKIAKHLFKTCLKYNDESRAENVDATNVNLAALYYDSKEYKKAWKYCEDAIQNLDSKRNSQPLELDTFCFIEDIPTICGFHILFNACIVKNGRPRQRMIEFAGLSLNFFARLLKVVLEQHLMKCNDVRSVRNMWKSVRNVSEKCMIIMLLNRCKNDIRNISISSRDTTRQAVNNSRISKCYFEDIEFSRSEKLRDLLAKLSIEYFSRFYNLNRDDASSSNISKTIVHYKALYHYRQKQYDKMLALYDPILNDMAMYTPGFVLKWFQSVSALIEIMILFIDDVAFLIGLMMLTKRESLDIEHVQGSVDEFIRSLIACRDQCNVDFNQYCENFSPKFPVVRPCFLLSYLRVQCLIRSSYLRRDISKALKTVGSRTTVRKFEYILTLFVKHFLRFKYSSR